MKRLLLVGGGHAHLEAIRQLGARQQTGVECVLASPEANTAYSGMLPGVVAGHYQPMDFQIDLAALAQRAGFRFVPQGVRELDASARTAVLTDGTRIAYDVLSLDTGTVADTRIEGATAPSVISLRPFHAFVDAWSGLIAESTAGRVRRIAVVGAGAAGVEIVLAMAYGLARTGGPAAQCGLALVTDDATILAVDSAGVRHRFERMLTAHGIELHCNSRVQRIDSGTLHIKAADTVAADRVVWAIAGTAPAWPKAAGLATDPQGYVSVDRHLRSFSHPEIFGGGDIVTMKEHPHAKSGVFAVRHGPVLAANLRAALSGAALRTYSPQQRVLSLISAGEKYAVASWGPWSAAGEWVWHWKDRIDRGFVAKYRESPA